MINYKVIINKYNNLRIFQFFVELEVHGVGFCCFVKISIIKLSIIIYNIQWGALFHQKIQLILFELGLNGIALQVLGIETIVRTIDNLLLHIKLVICVDQLLSLDQNLLHVILFQTFDQKRCHVFV